MSDYLAPALGIGLPFIGGAAGSIITKKNVKTWYRVSKETDNARNYDHQNILSKSFFKSIVIIKYYHTKHSNKHI